MQAQHVYPVNWHSSWRSCAHTHTHNSIATHARRRFSRHSTHATRVSEVSSLIDDNAGLTLFTGPFHSNVTIIYRSDTTTDCTWQVCGEDFVHSMIMTPLLRGFPLSLQANERRRLKTATEKITLSIAYSECAFVKVKGKFTLHVTKTHKGRRAIALLFL